MAGTFITGPSIVTGPLVGMPGTAAPQEYGVEFGPSIEYQGDCIPDVRYTMNKDNPVPGAIPCHLNSPYFLMTDGLPSASNTALTVAGGATNGTPFANIAASANNLNAGQSGYTNATLNIPLYNYATGALVSNAICLDFGWGSAATTSGSAVITPATGTMSYYSPGQWLVIGNVGNSGGTLPLIAQVLTVGTTTVTLSATAAATNSYAPVGSGNIFTNIFNNNAAATAHTPYIAAGVAKILDPKQTIARAVGVTGSASGTGGAITIRGYDIYGQPQSEVITATAGATTVWGKKAFKWFVSATPGFTDAHNYTIYTSDTFGYACRSDLWEYTDNFYNGTFQSASSSTSSMWVAGDQTSPATGTTGDVRGTVQVSARGANSATVTSTTYTDGTKRLAIFMTVPLYNLTQATPNNPAPLYGVTPFSS
jgi:hypothetical protein